MALQLMRRSIEDMMGTLSTSIDHFSDDAEAFSHVSSSLAKNDAEGGVTLTAVTEIVSTSTRNLKPDIEVEKPGDSLCPCPPKLRWRGKGGEGGSEGDCACISLIRWLCSQHPMICIAWAFPGAKISRLHNSCDSCQVFNSAFCYISCQHSCTRKKCVCREAYEALQNSCATHHRGVADLRR